MPSGYKADGSFAGKVFQKRQSLFPEYQIKKGQHISPKTEFKKGHKFGHRFKKGHTFWLGKKRPNVSGKNHYNWKNGIQKSNGRVFIKRPNHPFANIAGYVRRTRLVMEQKLGHYLKSKEIIHHINGIKNDDRIKNLQLFSNINEHARFHKLHKNY